MLPLEGDVEETIKVSIEANVNEETLDIDFEEPTSRIIKSLKFSYLVYVQVITLNFCCRSR